MIISLILCLLFLLGAILLTAFNISLTSLGRIEAKRQFYKKRGLYFFYFLLKKLFPKEEWDDFFFLISSTKQIIYVLYAAFALIFLLYTEMGFYIDETKQLFLDFPLVILFLLAIGFIPLILNFAIRPLSSIWSKQAMKTVAPFALFALIVFSPITFLLLKFQKILFSKKREEERTDASVKLKSKILELIHESDISEILDVRDQKLLTSIATFHDRIVKEIMVPRIDVITLSIHQTIEEAAKIFIQEGYSRLPVYRDDIDHIVGVLLYKDVLAFYFNEHQKPSSKGTVEALIKPILYTPETKKISHLLQEFRNKQIHLAIVVDEYGGTEGIITIEDILEEIVGEILDEYDFDEQVLFIPLAGGGWLVDAKMNILDIEKKLGIHIPASPEYETLGGYVYHKAGSIPSKGWRIHHDEFDLEVISSNERGINKVRIIPTSTSEPTNLPQ